MGNKKKVIDYFDKPKVVAIIGDIDTGKSNLVYYLINTLTKKFNFNLYTFGLRKTIKGAKQFHSVSELENMRDSIIFIDEFICLFDLDDRNKKREIENTLRLLAHNNNIIVLIGLPENFKKFLSAKVDVAIYKKVTFEDFINGCSVKRKVLDYEGYEKGSRILNLKHNEAMICDDSYNKIKIPYLESFDTKRKNVKILVEKKRSQNVRKT